MVRDSGAKYLDTVSKKPLFEVNPEVIRTIELLLAVKRGQTPDFIRMIGALSVCDVEPQEEATGGVPVGGVPTSM